MTIPAAAFGASGPSVSRLCQGTAFRSLPRDDTNRQGEAVLRHALERGVRFFDSSNAYGWGGSERLLGAALRGQRDDVVICTKVSPSSPPNADGSPGPARPFTFDYLQQELTGSLRRLDTEWIDLYLLHSPDRVTAADQLCESMQRLLDGGSVRHWGVSNHDADQVAALLAAARVAGTTPPIGLEEYYNIAGRLGDDGRSRIRRFEHELAPVVERERLGVLAFSPMDCGDLAPGRDVEAGSPLAELIDSIDEVARQLNVARATVCVAWVLAQPAVTAVLGGAETEAHVDEMIDGTTLVLPPSMLNDLSAASRRYSMQLEAP